MKQTVNERVKLLRTALRLTQSEFAAELKISASLISKIEQGEIPSIQTIDAIIDRFNVPEEWILKGIGEMKFMKRLPESKDPWQDALYKEEFG